MTANSTYAPDAAPSGEAPDFPMPRTCPFAPAPEYVGLRAEAPVSQVRVPDGQLAWLVTRYADVRRLLTDPRVSANRFHPNLPLTEPVTPQTRRNIAAVGRSLIGLDQPEHGPQRRMLIGDFTLRRAQEMRPHIQRTVDECVDAILAGPKPVDLVAALALPVPASMITKLLGMPYEDRDLIVRSADAQLRRHGLRRAAPADQQRAARPTSTGWSPRRRRSRPTTCSAGWWCRTGRPRCSTTTCSSGWRCCCWWPASRPPPA